MSTINTFNSKKIIEIDGQKYTFFDLNALKSTFKLDLATIPFTLKILLENLLRHEDGKIVTGETINNFCNALHQKNKNLEISFYPSRVLMQDFTGVPVVADLAAMREALQKKNIAPQKINPCSRVDLIIDHSVMVDSFGHSQSYKENVEKEFIRNKERYEFLKWGQNAFNDFHLVPPGAGICHQVNLEKISKTVWVKKERDEKIIFPDSVVGTDSHTTMVNSLSVLGWGVGGIEATASMLGEPISLNVPKVVGFKIDGALEEGVTATDLVLTITEKLRSHGVVGKFVEFYGRGLKNLTLADRATISNMAPEYGATCGFFPTDLETINYLRLTGKDEHHLKIVSNYAKIQKLWSSFDKINFDEIINFNLNEVETSVAGPKRPQDKILLKNVPSSFNSIIKDQSLRKHSNKNLVNGDIVLAAITSCTNTSNPKVMIAAGLVAKKAVEAGLNVKPWVKTSLAPGSKVVSDYLDKSGLTKFLDKIGFNLVGYGCTTCIGNSGPLNSKISKQIKDNNLVVCSVLSGNRNFEGRVHQEIKANYLASPPLVVAYALSGTICVNLMKEPIATNSLGINIYLKNLWPSSKEIDEVIDKCLSQEMFKSRYKEIYEGDVNWSKIKSTNDPIYKWNVMSTYIKTPPFFISEKMEIDSDILEARVLVMLGDSVTTDHISPAGAIKSDSPAGKYLLKRQINQKEFNSYGSRRGNHEIMMRGTFANIRLRNEIIPESIGGVTRCFINNNQTSIFDAAIEYYNQNIPLIVIAGKEYGTGSSRDWAAKGTKLLGVRAVIAESFERIHRSNLIGMGILPLEFMNKQNRKSLKLKGNEKFTIKEINLLKPNKVIECKIINDFEINIINLLCRIDTQKELEYFKAGGILHYILQSIEKKAA